MHITSKFNEALHRSPHTAPGGLALPPVQRFKCLTILLVLNMPVVSAAPVWLKQSLLHSFIVTIKWFLYLQHQTSSLPQSNRWAEQWWLTCCGMALSQGGPGLHHPEGIKISGPITAQPPTPAARGYQAEPQMKCFYDLVRNVHLLQGLGHSVPAQSPHGKDRLSSHGKVIRFRKGQRNINAQEIHEIHADSTHPPPHYSRVCKYTSLC